MKIPLSGRLGKGKNFLVDKDDYARVIKHTWRLGILGRPQTDIWDKKNKKSRAVLIGRFIMSPPHKKVIDHISGNQLDNRKSNLRVCSRKENQRNRGCLNKNNSSGFRGVSWDKFRKKWVAQLSYCYKHIFLGRYDSKEEARKAVRLAIGRYHKDFANLNAV